MRSLPSPNSMDPFHSPISLQDKICQNQNVRRFVWVSSFHISLTFLVEFQYSLHYSPHWIPIFTSTTRKFFYFSWNLSEVALSGWYRCITSVLFVQGIIGIIIHNKNMSPLYYLYDLALSFLGLSKAFTSINSDSGGCLTISSPETLQSVSIALRYHLQTPIPRYFWPSENSTFDVKNVCL